jgi:hypothetical protein
MVECYRLEPTSNDFIRRDPDLLKSCPVTRFGQKLTEEIHSPNDPFSKKLEDMAKTAFGGAIFSLAWHRLVLTSEDFFRGYHGILKSCPVVTIAYKLMEEIHSPNQIPESCIFPT